MELIWLYYEGLKNSRYILFLKLGERDNKFCGLDTRKISDSDRAKIVNGIHNLSLESAIRWLRVHYPIYLRAAYRELLIDRLRVEHKYTIDPSKVE